MDFAAPFGREPIYGATMLATIVLKDTTIIVPLKWPMTRHRDLQRITRALDAAVAALEPSAAGAIETTLKHDDDPVTEADYAVNDVLLDVLPEPGEGWLSEETADSADRLGRD